MSDYSAPLAVFSSWPHWNYLRYVFQFGRLKLAIHNVLLHSGVISFSNDPENPLPQTNCTLTTTFQQQVDFPLNLLLLLTGILLILIDIATTMLMCIIKWRRCGALAIVWFLVTTMCTAAWMVFAIIYLTMVVPAWQGNKDTCDYLVLVATLVLVGYHGILTVVYLLVIVVVIVFDCNRWYHMREVY